KQKRGFWPNACNVITPIGDVFTDREGGALWSIAGGTGRTRPYRERNPEFPCQGLDELARRLRSGEGPSVSRGTLPSNSNPSTGWRCLPTGAIRGPRQPGLPLSPGFRRRSLAAPPPCPFLGVAPGGERSGWDTPGAASVESPPMRSRTCPPTAA